MKRLTLSILLFLHLSIVSAQKFTIKDIPLYWSDFNQGKQSNGSYTATTYTSINKNYARLRDGDENILYLNLHLFINRGASSVDNNFLNAAQPGDKDALLNHEKCHLIISLFYFKKMKDSIGNQHFSVRYKIEIDSIVHYFFNQIDLTNITYDADTNHGLSTNRQLIWSNH